MTLPLGRLEARPNDPAPVSGPRSGGGGVSRESCRAAEDSEGPGEKRSDGAGAGVSGGASRGFLTSRCLMIVSLSLAVPEFLGRTLSLGRLRSRANFARSSLASTTLSLPERFTLMGEFIGSVFTLSASSLAYLGFAIVHSTYLFRELSDQMPL